MLVLKSAGAVVAFSGFLLAAPPFAAEAKKTDAAALARIQNALARCDIEARGSPAFRLRARLEVFQAPGRQQEGELLRIWTPVGLRREEIVLPGFRSVVVANGANQWISSTTDYTPFLAFQLEQVLNLAGQLREGLQMAIESPAQAAEGEPQCFYGVAHEDQYQYCFAVGGGELIRIVNGLWNVTYEYSDYAPWGEKSFPRLLRVVKRGGETLAEIRIDQIVPESRPALSLFLPGNGAREQPDPRGCGTIDAAKAVKVVKPEYPQNALKAGIIGAVRFYADIGTDGIPRGVWPLNSPSPVLADAALRAVAQWRYRPMVCHNSGVLIEAPTWISLSFSSR